MSEWMVAERQYCQGGDDGKVCYRETLLQMVGIGWQIKPNFSRLPGREEECAHLNITINVK